MTTYTLISAIAGDTNVPGVDVDVLEANGGGGVISVEDLHRLFEMPEVQEFLALNSYDGYHPEEDVVHLYEGTLTNSRYPTFTVSLDESVTMLPTHAVNLNELRAMDGGRYRSASVALESLLHRHDSDTSHHIEVVREYGSVKGEYYGPYEDSERIDLRVTVWSGHGGYDRGEKLGWHVNALVVARIDDVHGKVSVEAGAARMVVHSSSSTDPSTTYVGYHVINALCHWLREYYGRAGIRRGLRTGQWDEAAPVPPSKDDWDAMTSSDAPVLRATQGLPGAGKTTYALSLLGKESAWVRCNRDNIRLELFGRLAPLDPDPGRAREMEDAVEKLQHQRIADALDAGHDVVVDDTNVLPERLEGLYQLARATGARLEVVQFRVPVATAIARQADRPAAERVPASEILRLAALAPDLTTDCYPRG